jgi:hypothetical protein
VTRQTDGVRTTLALLAAIACGVLAVMNLGFFLLLLITKALIMFRDSHAVMAIAIFGGNTYALGWLALQAARRVGPRTA